jgi:hypothetical protein
MEAINSRKRAASEELADAVEEPRVVKKVNIAQANVKAASLHAAKRGTPLNT